MAQPKYKQKHIEAKWVKKYSLKLHKYMLVKAMHRLLICDN